jgi:hypothetical protein
VTGFRRFRKLGIDHEHENDNEHEWKIRAVISIEAFDQAGEHFRQWSCPDRLVIVLVIEL